MAIVTVGLNVWQLDAAGDAIPDPALTADLALNDPARREYLYLSVGRFIATDTAGLFELTDRVGNIIASAIVQPGDMVEVNLDCGNYDGVVVSAIPANGKILLEA